MAKTEYSPLLVKCYIRLQDARGRMALAEQEMGHLHKWRTLLDREMNGLIADSPWLLG